MRLRIASWNIHGGVGIDGRFAPERIARVLAEVDADVVALQEFGSRRIALDLRAHLEEATGARVIVMPTFLKHGSDFGNALLSRLPIASAVAHDLSQDRREPRNAIEAHIDCGSARLRVLTTHLGLRSAERRVQIARLHQLLAEHPEMPTALLGDFNEWRRGAGLGELDRYFRMSLAPATFPSPCAVAPLDRIWIAPDGLCITLQAHRSRLARVASDHLPLVATIELP